jgi:hypothetical protein
MAAIEPLDEEEAYLWAILSDVSGLDQAEFSWLAPEEPETMCFRAWPYQWPWWRDQSPQQIDQAGRSVGKSLSIKVRAFAFPFIHPNQEMVITAPEGNHLDAITDVVETAYDSTRLGREMMKQGRGGIKHRPFHMNFENGARIMGRIPQRDGKGVKGIHPVWLELDEAQDYPTQGWKELFETPNRASIHAPMWRAHGVTRGLRDYFHKFTQPEEGWKIHRLMAMHRPTWTDEERQDKIKQYGSADDPDYRRNVLGLHGDATNPIFVLNRLMRCVDDNTSSEYNESLFTHLRITNEMVDEYNGSILPMLDFPASHLKYKSIWIGMDVGYTNDPSEILIFAEETEKGKDAVSVLRLLTRLSMLRIDHENQVQAMLFVINLYRPQCFAMDKTGLGLPLFQDLQNRAKNDPNIKGLLDRIKGYNFSEKILVEIDDTIKVDEFRGDLIQEAGIMRNVLEYSTDVLRGLVDDKRIILPWDKQMIGEFQGQTYSYGRPEQDMYGRHRNFSKGSFHTLDAARMAACGWGQHKISAFADTQKKDNFTPTSAVFL